jgi:hydrogenase maturation protein HypF
VTSRPLPARRLRFTGVVQGVGFRPTAARVANALGLVGAVRNLGRAVEVELEGPAAVLDAFLPALRQALRPPARIDAVEVEAAAPTGAATFVVAKSAAADDARNDAAGPLPVPADLRPCADCLAEYFDPGGRRHLDPFVACVRCGPRASILRGLPFDRARTAMADFPLCADCRAEYGDPASRRFHAQTFCCPTCGPRPRLVDPGGRALADAAPRAIIAALHQRLRRGEVIAVKGVGGFQLVVDATNAAAVARLRARKRRPRQALAVMQRGATGDPLGPIALRPLPAPEGVAPDVAALGVMPPSSPLHLWLFGEGVVTAPLERLVVTSGNLHGEPLATDNADALRQLAGVADAFLLHDRTIERPLDDGVVDARAPALTLRLGRGAPAPAIALPRDGVDAFAAGGDHASAFALAHGEVALVGAHVGDLSSAGAALRYQAAVEDALRLHRARPGLVAVDAHPGYQSARFGRALAARWGVPVIAVQHHLAHAASVLCDHGVARAAALAFDGTGWGPDGTSWGGEALWLDLDAGRWGRVGGLTPSPLPGGDAAVREPSRQTWARCRALGLQPPPWARHPALEGIFAPGAPLAGAMPRSRSIGRLFDAAAGLLIADLGAVGYEAEAAVRLERLAGAIGGPPFALDLTEEEIDGDQIFAAAYHAARGGEAAAVVAARFHETAAAVGAALAERAALAAGTDVVALGGGAFQNLRLRRAVAARLTARGLRPLLPRRVPVGDGGLCLGQLAWARAVAGSEARGA